MNEFELDHLKRALVAADKAGDEAAARAIAAKLNELGVRPSDGPAMPHNVVKNPDGGYAMPSLVVPDEGMGDAMLKGAIRGASRLVDGVKQWFGDDDGEIAQRQKAMDAGIAPIQRNRPISTAVGEALPGVAITAPIMGGSSLLGAVGRGAIAGAIPGAVGYGDIGERTQRAAGGAVGGAAGSGVGYGIARALTPIANGQRISKDAAQAAARVGYKPTASEQTGSLTLENLENYLARVPGASRQMQGIKNANQEALNRAAARAIGESSDSLDEATMAAAKSRIGAGFDAIGQKARPRLDTNEFIDALAKIDATNKAAKSFQNPQVNRLVDKALELAQDGELDGFAYQSLRSELGRQAKSTTNNSLRDALKKLQGALDDAADASLSKQDRLANALLRKQYHDYKVLDKGMVIEGGDVSARRLASALKQSDGMKFNAGEINGDLMDIARIGRGIRQPQNPNSGSLMLSQSWFENPITGMAATGLNRAVGGMYLSPAMQRYLTMQALPPSVEPSLIRALTGAGAGGVSAAQNASR